MRQYLAALETYLCLDGGFVYRTYLHNYNHSNYGDWTLMKGGEMKGLVDEQKLIDKLGELSQNPQVKEYTEKFTKNLWKRLRTKIG